MDEETERLLKLGYLGPFSLPGLDLARLTDAIDRHTPQLAWPNKNYSKDLEHRPWFKSFHSLAPEFLDVARHPDILKIVHNAFSDRPTKLWGVAPLVKRAGVTHAWHSDIETRFWPTLTVWLGLKGVTKNTSLRIISHTHKLTTAPNTLRNQGRSMQSNEEVLSAAQALEPSCELIIPEMKDGDCIILWGSLWHGTHNSSSNTRYAATFQYSDAGADIRIPLNFEKPVRWHKQKPRCYRTD